MTVQVLIDKLRDQDPEDEVVCYSPRDGDGCNVPVENVNAKTVRVYDRGAPARRVVIVF
jgi:hypothetical protein